MDATVAIRLQGRRGVEQRQRRLRLYPLCVDCLSQGRVTQSEVLDHIVPLAKGGTDNDDNIRGLCLPHHHDRTREQFNHKPKITIGVDGWPVEE